MYNKQERSNDMSNKATFIISEGKKTNMVVEHTIVKDKKNRKGEPYKISVTKHVSKKKGGNK
jgi:hypothetical protein